VPLLPWLFTGQLPQLFDLLKIRQQPTPTPPSTGGRRAGPIIGFARNTSGSDRSTVDRDPVSVLELDKVSSEGSCSFRLRLPGLDCQNGASRVNVHGFEARRTCC